MTIQRLQMPGFSSVLIGGDTLLIGCGNQLLERKLPIAAVVTDNADIRAWADGHGLLVAALDADLPQKLAGMPFDWLFSIANLKIIPDAVLNLAGQGAVNFHDGPLPRYAGLNAPVWALINRETRHGVTWHMIEGGIDEGDIVEQRLFDVAADDTAFSLNSKCYAAGLDSFGALISSISAGAVERRAQDFTDRSYFGRDDRPDADGLLDFTRPAADLAAMVRALDHGEYYNPLCCAKLRLGERVLVVGHAEVEEAATAQPGTVLEVTGSAVRVACGAGVVTLSGFRDLAGRTLTPGEFMASGQVLLPPGVVEAAALNGTMQVIAKGQSYWRKRLTSFHAASLVADTVDAAMDGADHVSVDLRGDFSREQMVAATAIWAAQSSGIPSASVALITTEIHDLAGKAPGHVSDWLPLNAGLSKDERPSFSEVENWVAAQIDKGKTLPGFALDIVARDPGIAALQMPDIAINLADDAVIAGAAVTVAVAGDGQTRLWFDPQRIGAAYQTLLLARLQAVLAGFGSGDALVEMPRLLPEAERDLLVRLWNETGADYDRDQTIHAAFEAQAAHTPGATALVFEDETLSYAVLDARANQVAHVLASMGVAPGTQVGLCLKRSADMVVAALGILKAGGAYVPMDPAYPADRLVHYLTDSAAPVLVTESALAANLPKCQAATLVLDTDPRLSTASTAPVQVPVSADNLAYLIYTSGSTGTPKGVMVSHRNVGNFFAGMDAEVRRDGQGVWLGLTSLSFDISVLEVFYTLARGFKLVLSGEADRALVSDHPIPTSDRGMDFSLFFWGNDDGPGPKKYEMLLEGSKFADAHGFRAVWTPERHFHAFGGPYPNPSVTGAAVAAVTKNLDVRAGSCVAPLHHPARIAEDWAVIDNLTNGRAGLGIAAGWQPNDFVLRPENTPPNNKPAMYKDIETLRKLWRGEAVEFPLGDGSMQPVLTQPRPVSSELPIWVTTAGNPDTWREAGEIGANVLTHLLGQSIEEVGGKIKIYHQALRDAGYDPANHTVTLMLHTFVGKDREEAREIAREPMKDYLRSAAGLIKQYAWVFPAFKRPEGVNNAFDMSLDGLGEDELEAILEFAFLRYFEDSGLFGTVQNCLDRVEQLKRIGVDEVACLIDYGIPAETVLQGLRPLAEVLKHANTVGELAEDDFSLAAQIIRHDVSHMQCTPTLAQMITMQDDARFAVGRLSQWFVGGEALAPGLAEDLQGATSADIINMYGPTETTIWSTTDRLAGDVRIGRPIANTQAYVLDAALQPVPVGVAGELFIAGEGVTQGYWQREAMTDERFVSDPFAGQGRMYRTGDLVRWMPDGRLDYLGRSDQQVKIRGHRIELGEIEAVMADLPGIREAVVVSKTGAEDTRLMGFVTAQSTASGVDIIAQLEACLPDIMIPAHVSVLDAMPMTPNRKIDRVALARMEPVRTEPRELGTPETDTQAKVAAVWSKVLGVEGIGAKDNFFALGGHSLLAVQAHRELRTCFAPTRLAITDIFANPTLQGLAERIDGLSGAAPVVSTDLPKEIKADRGAAMSKRRAMRARREMEHE